MIELKNLTKIFGSITAVSNLNITIHDGEIFGFLGPNGVGKTTTIKMMVGLLYPTNGSIIYDGLDLADNPEMVKSRFAYLPDSPHVFEKLTGREFMRFVSDLYDLDHTYSEIRSGELLSALKLVDSADNLIESYSRGMKQKLLIAGALLHNPHYLIMDEPILGLDPASARLIKGVLRGLADKGCAVFMSTHMLEIAERICDRVGIIHEGNLIKVGTPEELRKEGEKKDSSLEDVFLAVTGSEDHEDLIRSLTGNQLNGANKI